MKKRKLGGLLVSLALILSLVITSTVTASAATTKINKTKTSVSSGSTITLKISNTSKKVTWTTSSKKIAMVKSTGAKSAKVTGKTPGKATITAKVGDKKFKCVVTVKKVGTVSNPASATKGVTYKSDSGTVYYKAKEIIVGKDAEELYKTIDAEAYENCSKLYYDINDYKLVALNYDVKAVDGFENGSLYSDRVIDTFYMYVFDEKCDKQLDAHEWTVAYTKGTEEYVSRYKLDLSKGESSTMCIFLLVPENVKAFTSYNIDKDGNKYWVKYTLPK